MGTMELGIAGRTAVVTGASRGIGAAVSQRLEAEGVHVVGISRADGIDVRDPDAARLVAQRAEQVDILVNNAGTSFVRSLDELTDEDWQAQYELNVTAPRRLMQAFAPSMAQRGWGRIVNVASSSGKRPSLTNAAYSVTKAAELSLSRVFAEAYAGRGVLVNAVAPGPVTGPLWLAEGGLADQAAAARGATRESVLESQAAKVPLGRFITVDEVAAAIVFLCSDAASAVTGAAWSVDGGTVPGII
jgi:3-oxoacyl-[acyl-carrier protein] reductase